MCLLLWFHIVDKRNILNSICVQRTAICCNRVFREAGERESLYFSSGRVLSSFEYFSPPDDSAIFLAA